MKSLREWQNTVSEWQDKNFPNQTAYGNLLGVGEEFGELCHAHLKGEQGIRHTPLEIHHMKQDAVGDIFIFLLNYCEKNNIDFQDALEKTWLEVSKRDWKLNKLNGKVEVKENENQYKTIAFADGRFDDEPNGEGAIVD
jgi:NTP pyrophosphatase (non-canonical NTP hydrolase)